MMRNLGFLGMTVRRLATKVDATAPAVTAGKIRLNLVTPSSVSFFPIYLVGLSIPL